MHIIYFVVARPLAFGSFPAPVMHPVGVHMGALKGTHYKRACEQVNRRINFGQNYRDLAQIVRVTFRPKLWAPIGAHMGALSGTHFSVPLRKLLPLRGRLLHVGQGRHAGTHMHIFRSVPLRDVLFFTGSFGPSNGYPIGYPCGHPCGAPTK